MREALRRYWPVLVPVLVVLGLVVGYLLKPRLVYDGFLWRFYWGPIVADSVGGPVAGPGGVVAYRGYNWVNTLTWGLVLGGALLGVLRLLERMDVSLGTSFVAAVTPFVLFGSTARALEDAGIVEPPVGYLFITPLIYVVVFLLVLGALLLGEWMERRGRVEREGFVAVSGTLLFGVNLLLFASGLESAAAEPLVPLQAAGLGLVLAGAVYLIGRYLGWGFLASPIGFGVVAAHMFDASSTFIGYTLGYAEKHVLPTLLIDATGTSGIMFPLKLAVVIPVLYYLDLFDEGSETFETLLYLTVLVLGLGPGTRNVARMAMGV
ncbi:MAG: hypothetical protein MAG715_00944 [Methanonatronarchaeales archaeon]|nr:hypothetical protein [Methanonatronarchaeales archaeon]